MPWPEASLSYANGAVAEAMILAGHHTNDSGLIHQGRRALDWLWQLQCAGGRLSLIPHKGWQPGDSLPGFDQQPIEVAALVDACISAYDVTSDPDLLERVELGRRWFEGHNDQAITMCDEATGAGYDALTAGGRNENQGAESTLAYMSVYQRAGIALANST